MHQVLICRSTNEIWQLRTEGKLDGLLFMMLHLFTLFHGAPEHSIHSLYKKVQCEHSKLFFSFGLYRFGMTWEWVIDRICLSNYYFKYSCLSLKLDTWQLRVWNRLPSEVPSCKNQLLGLKLFTTVDHLSLLWHKMHSMTASLK